MRWHPLRLGGGLAEGHVGALGLDGRVPDVSGELLPLIAVGPLALAGGGSPGQDGQLGQPGQLGQGGYVVGPTPAVVAHVRRLEEERHPRWLVPSAATSVRPLVEAGVRVQRTWDVAEVHRMLAGGWAADLPAAWALARGLDPGALAAIDPLRTTGDAGLFDAPDDASSDAATLPDGQLRRDLLDPAWARSPARLVALAEALVELAEGQARLMAERGPRATATAYSESAAAVLSVELEHDGLPIDRARAEQLIAASAGARPTDARHAAEIRAERDARVLDLAPGRGATDLRNPAQVKDLLAGVGVQVPNTRAWSLEPFRAAHPIVEALLLWRKDERIATTYGYRWLDAEVGRGDRLRGAWTACDGAAGRMTAQNGLHNLPAPLRPAVAAEPGHVFVRADLGQVEPRVLAAVSGDPAFAEATQADDLYAPVAAKLGVDRPIAKVAVLAAMYGQRSGAAGEALKDLERAYPVAMGLLDAAYESGRHRRPLLTYGGRLIPLDRMVTGGDDAARGRFARNAVIQGAAAELFKAWAATVRHETAPLGARIVLCLHDELLVHTPLEHAAQVEQALHTTLEASSRRWVGAGIPAGGRARGAQVRFVAETAVVRRWSEAKA